MPIARQRCFVLGLRDDETREDFAVQAAHRRGRQHAFRRAAGTHHRVHAGSDDRRGDSSRQVAVANQADARAGLANFADQLFVTRPVEHDHHEIVDIAAETAGDRVQVVAHRRVEADVRPSSSARRPASPCRDRARGAGRPCSRPRAPRSHWRRRWRTDSCPRADRRQCRPAEIPPAAEPRSACAMPTFSPM